jgi:glutaredoxin
VTNKPARLTVYSRAWCHLCDDLLTALTPLREEFGVEVDVIDVDEHPGLEERYGELVPVLMAGGTELCHYHLDTDAVRAYLLNLR